MAKNKKSSSKNKFILPTDTWVLILTLLVALQTIVLTVISAEVLDLWETVDTLQQASR